MWHDMVQAHGVSFHSHTAFLTCRIALEWSEYGETDSENLTGYIVANFIAMEITGYPHENGAGKGREKMYDNILSALQGLEERLVRQQSGDGIGLKIPVTKEDVGYLVEEVYRGKSVVTSLPNRLALIRWKAPERGFRIAEDWEGQKSVRLSLNELVCMTKEEAAIHEKEVLKGGKAPEVVYSEDVVRLVERRKEEERFCHEYR